MSRFHRRRGEGAARLRSGAVDAIARIRRDQAELEARIGVAFADEAKLARAVTDQRTLLAGAIGELRAAREAATRAADGALSDGGEAAAAPYRLAVDGYDAQLRVIEATAAQLDRLHGDASQGAEQSRRLLRESAGSLDAALRAEVELLARIERLDRESAIARVRRDDQPGEGQSG